MSLLFIDGFDHYGTTAANIARKWTSGTTFAFITGRYGSGSAIEVRQQTLIKNLPANETTLIVGFAYRFGGTAGGVSYTYGSFTTNVLVAFEDTTNAQIDLRVNQSTGEIFVTRNGTTLGTSTSRFPLGVWTYVEFKATINNSTGSFEVRLNGTSVLTGSSLDTQNTANAYVTRVAFRSLNGGVNHYIDDVYFANTSGSVNNDFLGPISINTIFPSAAGNSTQWTPSAGANYAAVDENPPNDDTDYVSETTAEDVDLYTYADPTDNSAEVKGIQINLLGRRITAGDSSTVAAMVRTSSTDYEQTTESDWGGATYTYRPRIVENNPNTTAPWTISELNSAEFGVKLKT